MNKIIFALISTYVLLPVYALSPISFDASMQTALYPFCMQYRNAANAMTLFHSLYDQFAPAIDEKKSTIRIPHIIHHIWLGSPLPTQYVTWRKTWMDHHPDWVFILWTDNKNNYKHGTLTTADSAGIIIPENTSSLVIDITTFPLVTKTLIERADNYGQRSDILRYEILCRFGGLYVDTDFSCLRSFDALHSAYDFYIGIQPLATNLVQLGIGLIGSIAHHPILEYTLEQLSNYDVNAPIVLSTGPLFFTKMFCAQASNDHYRTIAFPATYFYPWKNDSSSDDYGCKEETYAVHHWHGSWMKPEAHIH